MSARSRAKPKRSSHVRVAQTRTDCDARTDAHERDWIANGPPGISRPSIAGPCARRTPSSRLTDRSEACARAGCGHDRTVRNPIGKRTGATGRRCRRSRFAYASGSVADAITDSCLSFQAGAAGRVGRYFCVALAWR